MTDQPEKIENNKPFELSKKSELYLKETSNWTLFFSILGFILVGLLVLGSILVTIVFSVIENDKLPPVAGMFLGIFYFIFAIIYFIPIVYMYRFSTKMKDAIEKRNESSLETAFKNFKSHFKYVGILTIIMIILYIVMAVIMALSGALQTFW